MAGIGVRLNKIFGRNTLTTNMIGFFYSTLVTVAPMFAIIINLVLMEYFLKFSTLGYAQRELFSCTILYTFIFSLLTASPFNAVLSRYFRCYLRGTLSGYFAVLPYRNDAKHCVKLSCRNSILSVGAFCWRRECRLCVCWFLVLYQSGVCLLFDDLSVDL